MLTDALLYHRAYDVRTLLKLLAKQYLKHLQMQMKSIRAVAPGQ